ncbi:transmembrane protein 14A isoform X2 [Tenrec ecaudatus]|uniref:transmembrane protein 14A isoform X2 n=1 Tax=Tenrec ecaudatus TaxID=94439 RepID=UPI003F59FCAE
MRAAGKVRPALSKGTQGASSQGAGDWHRLQMPSAFQWGLLCGTAISCAVDLLLSDPSSQLEALPMDLIGFGFAALVTFGSVLGYKRTGGIPSLIGGICVGFLAGYGAYRISNDRRDVKVSLLTAFFLATIMGVQFKRSKKIMPAGLVAGLSLLMILRLVFLLF